jgi:glycosyltransferase involved in cell wall biosynthesis
MAAVIPYVMPLAAEPPASGSVVHLVGPVTDVVFSFLGPITTALAEQGIAQTVILVDEPAHRHLLPHFHSSIRLVLTPANTGPLQRFGDALRALLDSVHAQPTVAVHLHGVIPSLLGVYAARFKRLPQRLFFSPHGSRSLGPWKQFGALALWLLRPLSGRTGQRAIANSAADATTLRRLTSETVQLVESPVDAAFFEASRHEARHPLLVTSSRTHNPDAAAMYAQLAVLLGEESLDLSCNWLGTADTESLARLNAANVGVYDATEAADRASRLSQGWVYVAFGGALGFPLFLAEAMAAGLPCVVWDTPYHRGVIEHGKTGLLCNSQQQLLACVAELVDTAELRDRLGRAAREEASRRFDGQKFRESMLAAYSASTSNG